jgi:hypothetical protein
MGSDGGSAVAGCTGNWAGATLAARDVDFGIATWRLRSRCGPERNVSAERNAEQNEHQRGQQKAA